MLVNPDLWGATKHVEKDLIRTSYYNSLPLVVISTDFVIWLGQISRNL
jgi:hypothetical protein